jgi:hypothetical protein
MTRQIVSWALSAATDGWAWLHGRFMQEDSLVHRFAAPPEGTGELKLVSPAEYAEAEVFFG